MIKNEERTGIVLSLGMNGEGVLREDEYVIFVPYALPEEKIKYKVLKVAGKIVYGKLLEVFTPAENRVRPKCPVFTKCGGCQLQHLDYYSQLLHKENQVKNCFHKIANLKVDVKPTVTGEDQFYYRNKLQLPVQEGDQGTIVGFYAENSHRVIPIDDCVTSAIWTKDIISAFKKYFDECKVKGYNEKTFSGDVREITVKEINLNLIITVVSLKRNLKSQERLIEILKEKVKYNFSLFLNVNNSKTNVIYGEEFIKLYGDNDYYSEMLGIKYKIGVRSFMQVNTSVCKKLYKRVYELINADENTTVIDAYSGAGLMTALISKNAKKGIGVEIIPEAVNLANELAKDNGLDNKITNYLGKCEELLPNIIKREKEENSLVSVVLDPPRKGVDIKVIESLLASDIDKIVYVSCMPSTLARDVGLLVGSLRLQNGEIKKSENYEKRYEIDYLQTFDMFCNTKHVETLVCLRKVN